MREDTYEVSLSMAGQSFGVWDKMSGGGLTSSELKYKPGGMKAQRSLGGSRSVENITLSRLFDDTVLAFLATLNDNVGYGDCTVTKQMLTTRGIPTGPPMVYTGKLMSVTPPDVDSESDDAGLLEIEISTNGEVAI